MEYRPGHRAMQGERPVEQRLLGGQPSQIGFDPKCRLRRRQRLRLYRAARQRRQRDGADDTPEITFELDQDPGSRPVSSALSS